MAARGKQAQLTARKQQMEADREAAERSANAKGYEQAIYDDIAT